MRPGSFLTQFTLLIITAIFPLSAKAAEEQLKVCHSAISGATTVLQYAQQKDIYAHYGLSVELLYTKGASTAMATMLSGDVDLCQVSVPSMVNAAAAGHEIAIVAGLYNNYIYSLMVREEITKMADLKGKVIAIAKPGGATDAAARSLLQSHDLTPGRDVALLSIGGQSARIAAIKTGDIDATLVSVPATLQAEKLGFHQLIDLTQSDNDYLHAGIVTLRSTLAAKRPIIEQFLKAVLHTIHAMKADRETTIAVIGRFLSLDPISHRKELDAVYDRFVINTLDRVPKVSEDGVSTQLMNSVAQHPATANLVAIDLIDHSLLDNIVDSGFLQSLTP